MILLVVVVQSEDVDKLSTHLLQDGFRLTRINGRGGFLAAGSAILLLGVEDEQMPAITAIIEATCSTRKQLVNAWPSPAMGGTGGMGMVAPVEVLVGGAVVFGIPIQHFVRLGGLAFSPVATRAAARPLAPGHDSELPSDAIERMTNVVADTEPTGQGAGTEAAPDATPEAAAPDTSLVVAIVQREDSDTVVSALRDAGYRLTRIDTAGGFLRRGNATLLIGVEEPRLNDVLSLIHTNLRPRAEPAPIQEGMPMYGATVFVLDASHFLRF